MRTICYCLIERSKWVELMNGYDKSKVDFINMKLLCKMRLLSNVKGHLKIPQIRQKGRRNVMV